MADSRAWLLNRGETSMEGRYLKICDTRDIFHSSSIAFGSNNGGIVPGKINQRWEYDEAIPMNGEHAEHYAVSLSISTTRWLVTFLVKSMLLRCFDVTKCPTIFYFSFQLNFLYRDNCTDPKYFCPFFFFFLFFPI